MSTITFNCQQCGQSLEAPDDMVGESVDCPSCNSTLIVENPTIKPPSPKKHETQVDTTSASKNQNSETNVKQGALISGLVCFGLGVLLMFISLSTVKLYAPLFLAAFVLSIIAMAQKRVAGGVILLVLTILVPIVLFIAIPSFKIAKFSYEEAKSAAKEHAQTQKGGDEAKKEVEIEIPEPCFGINLGMKASELESRADGKRVVYNKDRVPKDEIGVPFDIWTCEGSLSDNESVKKTDIFIYNDRVFMIVVSFIDTSEFNYSALKDSLGSKYNYVHTSYTDEALYDLTFTDAVDDSRMRINLNKKGAYMGSGEGDLTITYTHIALEESLENQISKAKSSKIYDDL